MANPKETQDWNELNFCFYRPGKAVVNEREGYIIIEGSGCDRGEHWDGSHRIPLSSPDIDFWQWLVERYKKSSKTLNNEDLKRERDIFRKNA